MYTNVCNWQGHIHAHTHINACLHKLLVDECSFKCNCIQLLLNSIFFNFLPDFMRWHLCLLASILFFADSDSRILCLSAKRMGWEYTYICTKKYAYAYGSVYLCHMCVCMSVLMCCCQKCFNISLPLNGQETVNLRILVCMHTIYAASDNGVISLKQLL